MRRNTHAGCSRFVRAKRVRHSTMSPSVRFRVVSTNAWSCLTAAIACVLVYALDSRTMFRRGFGHLVEVVESLYFVRKAYRHVVPSINSIFWTSLVHITYANGMFEKLIRCAQGVSSFRQEFEAVEPTLVPIGTFASARQIVANHDLSTIYTTNFLFSGKSTICAL